LGTYATAEEAALAYDEAARVLYGSNALLNLPDKGPSAGSSSTPPSSGSTGDKPYYKQENGNGKSNLGNKQVPKVTTVSPQSAASGTTPETPEDGLDTADSGSPKRLAEAIAAEAARSPRRLAAEAILPESSSSWLADNELELPEPNRAEDLEQVREEIIEFDDILNVDDFEIPELRRSNSDSSTMTESSAFSKDLWADLACHMTISDSKFGSDISNDSTLTANNNMDKYGLPIEDLELEDMTSDEQPELTMPTSPEVEMLETSSLMLKKQPWTTLLPD
jgi:hypothetical protein